MEYERALFRVYDRSMEGLQSASARSACWYIQKSLLVLSAALFATLVLLHHRFVDEPGCIGSLIEQAAEREGLILPPKGDWVAVVGPNSTAGGEAAGAPGHGDAEAEDEEDEEHGESSGDDRDDRGDGDGDESENEGRVILLHSGVAIPNDVMIGIAIGEGGGGGSQNRRVWGLRGSHAGGRVVDGDRRLVEEMGGETGPTPPRPGRRRLAEESGAEDEDEELEGADVTVTNSSAGNVSSSESDSAVDFPVDYIFSFEPRVLLLPEKIRKEHGFRWLNFTLEPEECLSKAGAPARLLASRVVGYDVIMVNMFLMSSWSKGMLRNTETLAQWHWSKRAVSSAGWLSRAGEWVKFKLEVVLSSLLAFVLISTVTAMTVRTLLSSGVVIMFPLVMLMERMGMTIVGVHTLTLSYPWLGMPIEHLRTRNKPVTPFIMGHIMQMLVLYSVYNASLLAWSLWLYGKPMTTTLQLWLYGMVMLWEYFSLIFVRSRSSIVFFSRTAAISFLAFHVYFYHFQTGYFALAAGVCFTAMFAVKLYVLQYLELPAFTSGDISHNEPRAHYVELPWSTWDAALPPMWSLFIPPNASTVGVYGDTVPDRPDAPGPQDEEMEASATPLTRGGLRSRGRGRGRGRGASEAMERRRTRGQGRGSSGRDGGDDSGEGVEMTTRRRRATSSDVEEG